MFLVNGWFTQPGGRINLNPKNGIELLYSGDGMWMYSGRIFFSENEEEFEGILYDHCGVSTVSGTLRDGVLKFTKQYNHRSDSINYELRQTAVETEYSGSYSGKFVDVGDTKLSLTPPSLTFFVL